MSKVVELTPVRRSSNVAGTHHDPKSSLLTVQFHSGSRYQYPCTAAQYESLVAADSVGGHLYKHFIKGRSDAVKLAA